MSELLVQMRGIDKSFDNVAARVSCQFELRAGEVPGVYRKDAGTISLRGQVVDIPNPHAAQVLGITIIHQELNLMLHLTIAQYIFFGREPRSPIPYVLDDAKINQQALEEHQLHIPQDISLATFDDLPLQVNPKPFLTSIVQNSYRMGQEAVQRLTALLNDGDETQAEDIILPVELIIRGSTAKPLSP
jgi:hypothetical protein